MLNNAFEGGRTMNTFENKLVAVMNKNVDHGVIMNALAHMCVGFGANVGETDLQLVDYIDQEENTYPNISKIPFIILRANSNKIRGLRQEASQNNIQHATFTDTMTVGSWQDQVERTKQTKEQDLNYYGIVMFGDWGQVSEMTKKFSLWK